MGRVGTPEEVVKIILMLASDLASYVTGANIDINGGLTVDFNENNQLLQTKRRHIHPGPLVDPDNKEQLHISVNGVDLNEYPKEFRLKGKLTITNTTNTPLEVTRILFPSADKEFNFAIVYSNKTV